jgi:AcrR family transcriptional regulator
VNRPQPDHPPRKRRSDGERSREAILREAAKLATVEGLDGLSIARLAEAVGMSKSGLFAHFGSKEELQLATIDTARTLFEELVVAPAAAAPTPLERLRQLTENYLRYVDGTFPGGCFFASLVPEIDTRPGPVRDRALGFMDDWLGELERAVREAQHRGELNDAEDPQQLVFDLEASLFLGNALYVAGQGSTALGRARHAIERRLASATA